MAKKKRKKKRPAREEKPASLPVEPEVLPHQKKLYELAAGDIFNLEDGKVFLVLKEKVKGKRNVLVRPVHEDGSPDRKMPVNTIVFCLKIVPAHAGVTATRPASRQALCMEIGALVLRTEGQGPFVTGAAIVQHIERNS